MSGTRSDPPDRVRPAATALAAAALGLVVLAALIALAGGPAVAVDAVGSGAADAGRSRVPALMVVVLVPAGGLLAGVIALGVARRRLTSAAREREDSAQRAKRSDRRDDRSVQGRAPTSAR